MGIFHSENNIKSVGSVTVISFDTAVKGELKSSNTIQIDGVFEGKIKAEGRVIISEKGRLDGEITAHEIMVYGMLQGQIEADKVAIGAKGSVNAVVISDNFSIEEGGRFVGEKRFKTVDQIEALSTIILQNSGEAEG